MVEQEKIVRTSMTDRKRDERRRNMSVKIWIIKNGLDQELLSRVKTFSGAPGDESAVGK